MRIKPLGISAFFAVTLASASALSAPTDTLSVCTNANNPKDKIILNCTKLINDTNSNDRVKIIALINRGGAEVYGNLQLARVDLDQALKSYDKKFFSDSDQRLSSSKATAFTANGSLLTNIEWAQGFNSRGDVEANSLNFNAAIPYYQEAARINPWNDSYESSLGDSYGKRSEYPSAIQHLNQAVELNPNSAYDHLQRGIVFKESGDQANAKNDFEQAAALYQADINKIQSRANATGRRPRNLEIYFTRLGRAHLGAGETDSAINDFNNALKAKSDYELALVGLGQAYIAKQRYDLAVQNFNSAIDLNPKDALAYACRGQAYMESAQLRLARKMPLDGQRNDLTRAQDDLKQALYLDPSLADAHANYNSVNTTLARVNAELAQRTDTHKTFAAPPASRDESPSGPQEIPTVAPERRLAFSVGNDNYPKFNVSWNPKGGLLQSPRHDAQVMANELKTLNFQVTELENLNHDGYIAEYARFVAQVQPGDTVLIYFSGHGATIQGINLFLPTDTPLVDPDGGAEQLLSVGIHQFDLVKGAQLNGAKLVIVVSDACRDDPFASAKKAAVKSVVAGVSSSMRPTPVSGALMIYAAGAGQTALDGDSPTDNSLFTKYFAPQLIVKEQDLISGAENAKDAVTKKALPHKQSPAVYDETQGGKIYLNGFPPLRMVESDDSHLALKSLPVAPIADSAAFAPQ